MFEQSKPMSHWLTSYSPECHCASHWSWTWGPHPPRRPAPSPPSWLVRLLPRAWRQCEFSSECERVTAEDWRVWGLRTYWPEERGWSERSLVNVGCCLSHCGETDTAFSSLPLTDAKPMKISSQARKKQMKLKMQWFQKILTKQHTNKTRQYFKFSNELSGEN